MHPRRAALPLTALALLTSGCVAVGDASGGAPEAARTATPEPPAQPPPRRAQSLPTYSTEAPTPTPPTPDAEPEPPSTAPPAQPPPAPSSTAPRPSPPPPPTRPPPTLQLRDLCRLGDRYGQIKGTALTACRRMYGR